MELADVADLKSAVRKDVPVQVRPWAPYALVVELADASDSKSDPKGCGFESHLGHLGGEILIYLMHTSFHLLDYLLIPNTLVAFICLLSPTAETTGLEPVQ